MKNKPKFIKAIKHAYYYIPPCPVCKSYCTGRYIQRPFYDANYVEEQSLKHGEIVRFAKKVPHDNAFCVDCGHEWPCEARTLFLTRDRIENEIKRRGTREAYEEIKAQNKAERDRKNRNPVRRILNFLLLR